MFTSTHLILKQDINYVFMLILSFSRFSMDVVFKSKTNVDKIHLGKLFLFFKEKIHIRQTKFTLIIVKILLLIVLFKSGFHRSGRGIQPEKLFCGCSEFILRMS